MINRKPDGLLLDRKVVWFGDLVAVTMGGRKNTINQMVQITRSRTNCQQAGGKISSSFFALICFESKLVFFYDRIFFFLFCAYLLCMNYKTETFLLGILLNRSQHHYSHTPLVNISFLSC